MAGRRSGVVSAVAAATGAVLLAGCAPTAVRTAPTAVRPSAAAAVLAGRCPGTKPSTLTSNVPGLAGQLVPLPTTSLLICGYRTQGLGNPNAPTHFRVMVTGQGDITRLRSALDALPPRPRGTFPCPMDTGEVALEVFTDPASGQEVEVQQDLTGCATATNGPRTGWVGGSDAGTILASLLPADVRATLR
jgi:hypothetical protein